MDGVWYVDDDYERWVNENNGVISGSESLNGEECFELVYGFLFMGSSVVWIFY